MKLKRISTIVIAILITIIPIVSMAESKFTDSSTDTIITFPEGWEKFQNDKSFFQCCYGKHGGGIIQDCLYYLSEGITRSVPSKYLDELNEKHPDLKAEQITTTSFPLEMYADLFDQPIEYFSIIQINGIDYVKINYYVLQDSILRKNSPDAWFQTVGQTQIVVYVSIIASEMYLFQFEYFYPCFRVSDLHGIEWFERDNIPVYESILGNVSYSYFRERQRTTIIIVSIAAVVFVLILILIIQHHKKKNVRISYNEGESKEYASERLETQIHEAVPMSQSVSSKQDPLPSFAQMTDNNSSVTCSSGNEAIRYCRKCGKPLLLDSIYCESCGTKIK